jgi:hypothetical protein
MSRIDRILSKYIKEEVKKQSSQDIEDYARGMGIDAIKDHLKKIPAQIKKLKGISQDTGQSRHSGDKEAGSINKDASNHIANLEAFMRIAPKVLREKEAGAKKD